MLLTTPSLLAQHLQPQLGEPFYAGRTDLIQQDVALDPLTVIPQQSDLETLRAQTLAVLAEPVAQARADLLETQADVLPALRSFPSAIVVQSGPTGRPRPVCCCAAHPLQRPKCCWTGSRPRTWAAAST